MMVSPKTDDPPHDLGVVIDFVNTLDIETGVDDLAEPASLPGWLSARNLRPGTAQASPADHRRAIALREALRTLMLANTDGAQATAAAAELEQAAARGSLHAHFGAGGAHLEAEGEDLDAALARLVIPVFDAMRDGSWERTKACRADDCHWAFYDRSRNRSGVWCDMAVCGNRTKVRAFRERTPRA